MERDLDLVRLLLLEVEKTGKNDLNIPPSPIKEFKEDTILYHLLLMKEAGLIEVDFVKGTTFIPKMAWVHRLTWEGHEFLDAARKDAVWQKAKKWMMDTVGALTLEGMKIALAEVIKESFNKAN
jgi:hypothetical protein